MKKNRSLPLLQLSDMVHSYNFHWECLITYVVDRWRLQFDHVTLPQNGFWSVYYILDPRLKC